VLSEFCQTEKNWRFESAGRGWIELLDLGFVEVSEGIVLVTCERNDDYIRFSSPVGNQLTNGNTSW